MFLNYFYLLASVKISAWGTATHLFTQLLAFTVNILQQHGETMLELQLKFHA